jgi:preflagellin peptidase FlaK
MLPFFYAAIIVSITGLFIATYTDLKSRIVPNKLNYGLAIIGLLIFGTQSIFESSTLPLIYSALGLCLGFFFAWMLWKAGVFAGGDVKLFMALGALNPFTPALIKSGLLTNTSLPLFPLTLFIYSLLAFLPYGLFVVTYKLLKNKKMLKEIIEEMKPKTILALHASIFAAGAYTLLSINPIYLWTTLPLVIIWGFLGKKKKYATLAAVLLAFVVNYWLLIQAAVTAILFSVVLYTIIKFMFSSTRVLSSKVNISKLEEGMIPAKTLFEENGKIKEEEKLNLGKIIKLATERNIEKLQEMLKNKREVVSSKKARGLTEEEIMTLNKLAKKGLIPKTIAIKESMPFVPTMLLGYIFCLILGDLVFILLGVI